MLRPSPARHARIDFAVLEAFRKFGREYARSNQHMQSACRQFFRDCNFSFSIQRNWNPDQGGILFFADHDCLLDGNALPLACPDHLTLRRVIYWPAGRALGREFAKHNLLIWPRLSWKTLIFDSPGWGRKFRYFVSHRCGPFAYFGPWSRPGRNVEAICKLLASGISVAMLPSGAIGDRQWRSGIGAILRHYEKQSSHYHQPLRFAPIYLQWDHTSRHLQVDAPELVDADLILKHMSRLEIPTNRIPTARYLEDLYRSADWSSIAARVGDESRYRVAFPELAGF